MEFGFTGPAKVADLHYERKHLIAFAQEKGHEVQNKVDASTNYLVCNLATVPAKLTRKKAASLKYKAPQITPIEFLKMMGFV
jgi:hypothetical protein